MNVVRTALGLARNDRRFPKKGTCMAIYSRCVSSREKLPEVLAAHFPWCRPWVEELAKLFDAYTDRKDLVRKERVVARYQRIVDEVNATLAPYETIKRLAVVAEEWSIEGDELTPSMKLKRRVVEHKYAAEIAAFYQDEATATK